LLLCLSDWGVVVSVFKWPVRVYWEDTDAGGIVYYANYLKFMERARTEWLRSMGFEQADLQREQQMMFVVVDAAAQFKKPARYGDALLVSAAISEHTRATFTFKQDVVRAETQELLVAGTVRVACLDSTSLRPRALPAALLEKMAAV
jgi:acyl-CoA thioester hydrolase